MTCGFNPLQQINVWAMKTILMFLCFVLSFFSVLDSHDPGAGKTEEWSLTPFGPGKNGVTIDEMHTPDFDRLGVSKDIRDQARNNRSDVLYRFHLSEHNILISFVFFPKTTDADQIWVPQEGFVEIRKIVDGSLSNVSKAMDERSSLTVLRVLSHLEVMDLPPRNSLNVFGGGWLSGEFLYMEEVFGNRNRVVVRNVMESYSAQILRDRLLLVAETGLLHNFWENRGTNR